MAMVHNQFCCVSKVFIRTFYSFIQLSIKIYSSSEKAFPEKSFIFSCFLVYVGNPHKIYSGHLIGTKTAATDEILSAFTVTEKPGNKTGLVGDDPACDR